MFSFLVLEGVKKDMEKVYEYGGGKTLLKFIFKKI